MKYEDPIDRIRQARHRISESVGHDPKRLVEHYRRLQERFEDRLIPSIQFVDNNDAELLCMPQQASNSGMG